MTESIRPSTSRFASLRSACTSPKRSGPSPYPPSRSASASAQRPSSRRPAASSSGTSCQRPPMRIVAEDRLDVPALAHETRRPPPAERVAVQPRADRPEVAKTPARDPRRPRARVRLPARTRTPPPASPCYRPSKLAIRLPSSSRYGAGVVTTASRAQRLDPRELRLDLLDAVVRRAVHAHDRERRAVPRRSRGRVAFSDTVRREAEAPVSKPQRGSRASTPRAQPLHETPIVEVRSSSIRSPSFARRSPVVRPSFARRLPVVCPSFARRLPVGKEPIFVTQPATAGRQRAPR